MGHHMQMGISTWVRRGFFVASSDIGIDIFQGHALNKILKDIINRYHVLLGHRVQ
jgi:hypothetical protein